MSRVIDQDSHDASEPLLGETHATLNDCVRDAVREAIIAGEFKPGDRLVEGRLAARFGVSRNPVREALKSLDSEGFVTMLPRRGAFVAEMAADQRAEIIELRAALEGLGARLAARRLDPSIAERLPSILDQGETAADNRDLAELRRLNDEFHSALAEASSNRYLTDVIRSLRARTHWLFAAISEERAVESWREHAAIMRAVLDRDADMAELLATRHVTNVGSDLLASDPETSNEESAA